MNYFLLTYEPDVDRATVTRYEVETEAFAALERETLDKRATDEVVLFVAESEETLRRTHSRYFYDAAEMVDSTLEAILD